MVHWWNRSQAAWAVGNVFFSETHWILAHVYYKIANNMPKVIEKQHDQIQDYSTSKWVCIVLNAVFPLLYGILEIIEANKTYKGEEGTFIFVASQIAFIGMAACWTVSGCILIWGILAIRRFFKSRDQTSKVINIQTLVLHSSAFGLFLVSVILYEVVNMFCMVSDIIRHEQFVLLTHYVLLMIATPLLEVCAFFSQALLCVIFVQLSATQQPDQTGEEQDDQSSISSFKSIEVKSFDEEAEVQARIWNAFTRSLHGIEDCNDSHDSDPTNQNRNESSSPSLVVTPQQVY